MLLERTVKPTIMEAMEEFPVVAILGPRQCGKSTLVKKLLPPLENLIYLDLEKRSDLQKISEPEIFLESNRKNIVCIDEIQLAPEFFSYLRSEVDEERKNGRFLILGSVSKELLKQSAESLAGRISYIELTPFLIDELENVDGYEINNHWIRGGFPDSLLTKSDEVSYRWRENFIKTYIERDVARMGINLSSQKLYLFLSLLCHSQGQMINVSKTAQSLEISTVKLKSYLEILEDAYLIRLLRPIFVNGKKRLIKSPKIYFRDSGLLHNILEIESFNELMGHPIFGASWEGFAMEQIITKVPKWKPTFYRTSHGAEIDLVLTKKSYNIAIEFKASKSPKVTRGFYQSMEDLNIQKGWIICPINDSFLIKENVKVSGIPELIQEIRELI